MTIDHAMVYVQNDAYPEALKIYTEALKPLGYDIGMQFGPTVTGMTDGAAQTSGYKQSDFWIVGVEEKPNAPVHVALRAKGKSIQMHPPDITPRESC
jgi:hypothetical protein